MQCYLGIERDGFEGCSSGFDKILGLESASWTAFLHSRIVILVLSVVSILDALDAELKENRIYVIQICCSQFTINCQ